MEHNHDHQMVSDSFFGNLFKVYIPRRQCMFQESELIGLHVFSDALIAVAYFSIPIALIYFARKRKDLAFNWMFPLFAAFIILCGTTHILGVISIWQPVYRIDGLVKLLTGIVSISTSILLWRLMPMALALPSMDELSRRKDALEVLVEQRTAELNAAKEEAESASNAKTEFLANMSHEIRTPMHAILGLTALLQKEDMDNEKKKLLFDALNMSAQQLMALIDDLLDIAKIENNSIKIEQTPFRLAEILQEVASINRVQAENKGITLKLGYESCADLRVVGDPHRLKQVLMNIVGNAVKFTGHGHVDIQARCERSAHEANIVLDITDTGIGIPADKLDSIFAKFTQADSSIMKKYGGTGLGLSIAKNLLHLMDGSISVKSAEGQGSVFTIQLTLPLATNVSKPEDNLFNRIQRKNFQPPLRILVVEDNPANVFLMTSVLDSFGYKYVVAENGKKAVDFLENQMFDAVLMDLQMPVMDGFTATRIIREQELKLARRRTPIIGVTAYAFKEDREKCFQAGMDYYLTKPFNQEQLQDLLVKLTGNHKTEGFET